MRIAYGGSGAREALHEDFKSRFGGWIRDRLEDRSVMFLSKIAQCKRSLVKLRWYKLGGRYLYLKVGIPIGGPVSGIVLEAVLSVDEYISEKSGW